MGKPEVKRLVGRNTCRWKYNIKMDFKLILWAEGGWWGGRGLDFSGR